ncbi:MAG: glycosyltransferase [Deltaproteobacteria bacterium]|jgi:spore maturation protein CgeB|nr:glycosyltransferase [Deltaproteobacteria bacterium]
MPERILVVLPFYGGSLPVGRYCVSALRDNGCLVDVFEAPQFYGGLEAFKSLKVRQDRLDFLENSFLGLVGDALLAQVERFQPDLVLCMAQAPISRKVLKRLRHEGVATAMWFVEDYRLFTYWRAFAPLYDFFAVIQKEPFLSELRDIGVENALYLPLAALPQMHRPLRNSASGLLSNENSENSEVLGEADRLRFGADFSFMGAGYPNRRLAFRRLAALAAQNELDFRIWGTEWENEPQLEKHLRLKGVRIGSEDTVRIFNAAKINLNLHSSVRPEASVSRGDFVNPRTFEIAACGAFQLVDERDLLPELFAADELATFSSLDELTEKIGYYLSRPEERNRIARLGRERVLSDHTYQQRMKTLLGFIRERKPGWPPSLNAEATEQGGGWPADLPPELRTGLEKLRLELQLPPSPDFDSMIAALRSRSGKLDSLECSLLFLDEWKKQYSR